ncbi:MAG: PRTRC system ThiF family protein [Prevotella sp.]
MNYKHFVHNYMLNPQHQLTVNVIGAGGTGSQVLTALGRMNFALVALGHPGLQVTVYDADIVTPANYGRQLFAPQEVGLNKADVLVTKLNMFFGTAWASVPEMYGEQSNRSNITISCVDTAKARLEIEKSLAKESGDRYGDIYKAFYWLDYGNTLNSGQVVLGSVFEIEQPKKKRSCVGKLKCITDVFDLTKVSEKDSGPSCSLAEALSKQDLFINSTLANVGMALLWKMFTKGVLDTQGAFVNLETMKVNPIKIESDKRSKC